MPDGTTSSASFDCAVLMNTDRIAGLHGLQKLVLVGGHSNCISQVLGPTNFSELP
jgi:hypothetical protein